MNDQMAVLLTALVVAMENSIARGSPEEAQRDIPTTALSTPRLGYRYLLCMEGEVPESNHGRATVITHTKMRKRS
jgi:hypothetical protein